AVDEPEPRPGHRAFGRRLLAHELHRRRGRAHEGHAVLLAESREDGVLGEEAPAGVEGAAPGLARGLHEPIGAEVTLARARRAHADDLTPLEVRGAKIRLRGRKDGRDPEPVAGLADPHRDLTTIRHEEAPEANHRANASTGPRPDQPVRASGQPYRRGGRGYRPRARRTVAGARRRSPRS